MRRQVLLITLVLITIVNIVLTSLQDGIILLNENQILYSLSTMAQVIAGLFGLILASYAIIDPKLAAIGENDETSKEFVEVIRNNSFSEIKIICFFSASAIFLSILTIFTYNDITNSLFSLIVNETVLLFVLSVISILLFGCYLLNPNEFNKLADEEKKKVESNYKEEQKDDYFKPFVYTYNKLEELIINFANDLMKDNPDEKNILEFKNLRIMDALKILGYREIINKNIMDKINEFRVYRNAIVHSIDDQSVNEVIFEELENIYKRLSVIYENRDKTEARTSAIKNLYEYGKEFELNFIQIDILNHIKENPKITVSELAQKLKVSRNAIAKNLNYLIELGKVSKIGDKFKIL